MLKLSGVKRINEYWIRSRFESHPACPTICAVKAVLDDLGLGYSQIEVKAGTEMVFGDPVLLFDEKDLIIERKNPEGVSETVKTAIKLVRSSKITNTSYIRVS